MTRDEVVAEARSWIGTPYQHQAHLRGVGCDCAGLVGGVAVALGIVSSDWWEKDFAPYAGYGMQPIGSSLIDAMDAFMDRIDPDQAKPGDVIAMRFRRDPQHVAILAPYPTGYSMIHALNMGDRKVAEHRIDPKWMKRITHAFKIPGVN